MIIIQNFFNKLTSELDKKYYPDVKYYHDNKHTQKIHYAVELFNNGCSTYPKLIKTLATNCKDTPEVIHQIVSKYIKDFGDYEFKT